MKKEKRSLEQDLMIEVLKIEEEVTKQPALYHYYGEKWVDACKLRDAVKIEVEEVYAQRESFYRRKLSKKSDKVTEAMIKAKVYQDELYKKVQEKYLDIKYEAEQLGIIKEALKQKKDMIEVYAHLVTSSFGKLKLPESVKIRR